MLRGSSLSAEHFYWEYDAIQWTTRDDFHTTNNFCELKTENVLMEY